MRLSEKQLIKLMNQLKMVARISDLSNFPWSKYSYSELIKLIENKQIILAVLYDPDARHTVLSKKEKIFTDIIGNLIFLIPISFIIMAVWTKEWFLLLGSPSFLIAAFLSNPWARKIRQFLISISFVIAIVTAIMNYYYLALLFGGLCLSLLLTVFAREYVNGVVKREVTKSEALFCYTFQTGLLLLKDTVTDEIY